MPWISLQELEAHIIKKLRVEHDTITLDMVHDMIEQYPKREKKQCGCDHDEQCKCVIFGLYNDYVPEFEYFVEDTDKFKIYIV